MLKSNFATKLEFSVPKDILSCSPQVWCVVTAALLHYFLLCMFSWMLSHGAIFYYLIIRAELRDKLKPKMKWFYAFGWGKRKRHTLYSKTPKSLNLLEFQLDPMKRLLKLSLSFRLQTVMHSHVLSSTLGDSRQILPTLVDSDSDTCLTRTHVC